ncbi:MAG: sigma-54 dependent transcriptional regulator [Candidatus Hydrogenedentota bacterium]
MQTVLAIDDEPSVRQAYRAILNGEYNVLLAENGARGLELLDQRHVDLVLLDLTMPGMSGEEVLATLQKRGIPVPVIVVTASNTITSAVEAMRLGAQDYILKPFDVDELLRNVERTIESARQARELYTLRERDCVEFESIVGNSPALMRALGQARQAMKVDSTVLITGESGTGKDVVARAIHTGGLRKNKPFVALSCCAIPANLVESELFGYTKGAFTGADQTRIGKLQVADGGTLFLDEIGEMPVEAQVKLLRVLQDNRFYPVGSTKEISVNIRLLSATNRDLPEAISKGQFREDLYYRLNVLNVHMPALRERREDVPALAAHFIAKHAPRVHARAKDIDPRGMARLSGYAWPGNIRELENVVERILVHYTDSEIITAEQVVEMLPRAQREPVTNLESFEGLPLDEATRRLERYLIKRALERHENVQSRAADALGTTRRILKYKMDQLEIPSEQP